MVNRGWAPYEAPQAGVEFWPDGVGSQPVHEDEPCATGRRQ